MSDELVSCTSCGAKNLPTRSACVRCHGSIMPLNQPQAPSKQPEENTIEPVVQTIKRFADSWTFTRSMQTSLVSAILLATLSVFYYLVLFAPKQEKERAELQKSRFEAQRTEAEAKIKLEATRVALELMKEQDRLETRITNQTLR